MLIWKSKMPSNIGKLKYKIRFIMIDFHSSIGDKDFNIGEHLRVLLQD